MDNVGLVEGGWLHDNICREMGDGSPQYFGGNHGWMDLFSLLGLVGFMS